MSAQPDRFAPSLRVLHWLMAVLIVAMLGVGLVMTSSLTLRPLLLDIHRPLGVAILLLVLLLLGLRLTQATPPLPASLPRWQVWAAQASHVALYALMLAMPLLGWAMLSAGGMPVQLWPGTLLPALVTPSPTLYSLLHQIHQLGAWALAALVLGHNGAALLHAWVHRDGVWQAMAGGKRR